MTSEDDIKGWVSLKFLRVHGKERELKKHSYLAVGKRYLDHLLRMRRYEAAGALCSKLLAKDKKAWEEQVFR
jgi:hypothetical protein